MSSMSPLLPKYLNYDSKKGGYYLDWRCWEAGVLKRKRKVLGHIPKAKALAIHAKFYEEMTLKKVGLGKKGATQFKDAAELFLRHSKDHKRSFKDDSFRVGNLLAFFGDVPFEKMNQDAVDRYKVQRKAAFLSKHGREMKPASLNRELACLKSIGNMALKNGLIDQSPFQGMRLLKENNERNRVLSLDELRRLLAESAEHLKPVIQLAYETGMRMKEVLGLRWAQVDMAKRLIFLDASQTKTNEKREVPFSASLAEVLRQLPRSLKNRDLVFHFQGMPLNGVRTAFKAACRRAGLKDFRFHDLRHCAVTNLRKAGVQDHVIMAISGHKSVAMFKRYNSIDREDKALAMAKVGQFLETLGKSHEKAA